MRPSLFAMAFLLLLAGLPEATSAEVPAEPKKASAKAAKAGKVPPPRCVMAPVDLAVTPRISLNRLYRPCAWNLFGLALGASKAGQLRGLQLGIGVNGVERDAVGAQIALGINAVGGDAMALQVAGLVNAGGGHFTGVQIAGLMNASGDGVTGLQVALLGNATGGDAGGIQLSGLFNAAGDRVRGLQAAGLFNAAGKDVHGLQFSGGFNAAGDRMRGIQLAGLFNAAGDGVQGLQVSVLGNAAGDDSRALQVAGILNAVGGEQTGMQVAGILNGAGRLRGAQIAGAVNGTGSGEGLQIALAFNRVERDMAGVQIAAVNMSGDVDGAQIGLVNIARRVRGMQLGLVNVADRVDAPIGAFSWVRDGERAIEGWGGEVSAAAVRLGSRRVYSIVGLASAPWADGTPWGPVAGAGVQFSLGRIRLLADGLAHSLFFEGVDDQALLVQGRARLAYHVTERVAVLAGPTWNVFVSEDVDGGDLPLGPDWLDRSGGTAVRQWPGLTAGASFRL